ncbi:conserved hypothetical protein, partial [Ricinus communis]
RCAAFAQIHEREYWNRNTRIGETFFGAIENRALLVIVRHVIEYDDAGRMKTAEHYIDCRTQTIYAGGETTRLGFREDTLQLRHRRIGLQRHGNAAEVHRGKIGDDEIRIGKRENANQIAR